MVQYKLTYGDARGLGEPARLVLHYAGVQFEDDRLSDFSVVETIRDLLTIDGTTKLAQSQAICRFLARKHGLAGKDDVEQALVDSYGDFLMDLMTNLRPYFIFLRTGEGDKEKTLSDAKTYIETKWEKYFNKIVEGSGSGFLAKSGVTWPDFIVANFYETCKNLEFAPILNIKHFKTVHDSVKALPQLKEYFANRKQTQF